MLPLMRGCERLLCDGEGKVGGKRSGGGSESGKTLEIELPAGLNDWNGNCCVQRNYCRKQFEFLSFLFFFIKFF